MLPPRKGTRYSFNFEGGSKPPLAQPPIGTQYTQPPMPPQPTGGNLPPLPDIMSGQKPPQPPQTQITGGNLPPIQDIQSGPKPPQGQTMAGSAQAMPQTGPQPLNLANFNQFSDAAYAEAVKRLDPQWQQADDTFRQQMVNRGISEGTEAYDKAFANMSGAKNDAYGSARNNALAQALAAQGQAFGQDFSQQRADMGDLMSLLGYGNNVTQGNNATLNSDMQRASALFGLIPGMSPTPVDVMNPANMWMNQTNVNNQNAANRTNAMWNAAGQVGSAFLGGWGK